MKKLYLFLILFYFVSLNIHAKAVICGSSGNCMEVTEVNMGNGWVSCCCNHLPHTGTCTDDCSSTSGGGNNYPDFNEVPGNLITDTGNEVWIFKNGEHSTENFAVLEKVNEFLDLVDMSYDANLHYVNLTISDHIFVVIGKVKDASYRSKSLLSDDETLQINIYPIPSNSANAFYLESEITINSIVIYDLNGRVVDKVSYKEQNTNRYQVKLNRPELNGLYMIRINTLKGVLDKKVLFSK